MPLNEGISVVAGGGGGQSRNITILHANHNDHLAYHTQVAHEVYQGGVRLYPAALAREPFNDAAQGNPDGFLYWPMLGASLTRISSRSTDVFLAQKGAWGATKPAPTLYGDVLSLTALAVLPLHRYASLGLQYQRDLSAQVMQGGRAGSVSPAYHGFEAFATFYAPLFLREDHGDPDDYFPGLGWAGELAIQPRYALHQRISGERLGSSLSLGLAAPLFRWLAVQAGYEWNVPERGYFSAVSSFKMTAGQLDNHTVSAGLSFSLGGLGWF